MKITKQGINKTIFVDVNVNDNYTMSISDIEELTFHKDKHMVTYYISGGHGLNFIHHVEEITTKENTQEYIMYILHVSI